MNRIYPTQFQNNIIPPSEYMINGFNSLNPYNYKDLGKNFENYKDNEYMYYNTYKPLPISSFNYNERTRDPSNLLPDSKPLIYSLNSFNHYNGGFIKYNPDLWRDYTSAKPNPVQTIRPISAINAGYLSSVI